MERFQPFDLQSAVSSEYILKTGAESSIPSGHPMSTLDPIGTPDLILIAVVTWECGGRILSSQFRLTVCARAALVYELESE